MSEGEAVSRLLGSGGWPSTRLILIRGNSGCGKSAVAAGVRAARPPRTVAVVGQDVIRRTVLGAEGSSADAVGLLDLTARYALAAGRDVVVEGILNADHHVDMLRRLAADHRGVTRSYVYDLSFEETVRRHASKPAAANFGEDEMRAWWYGFQPVDGLGEAVLGPDCTLDETVRRVLVHSWPDESPPG